MGCASSVWIPNTNYSVPLVQLPWGPSLSFSFSLCKMGIFPTLESWGEDCGVKCSAQSLADGRHGTQQLVAVTIFCFDFGDGAHSPTQVSVCMWWRMPFACRKRHPVRPEPSHGCQRALAQQWWNAGAGGRPHLCHRAPGHAEQSEAQRLCRSMAIWPEAG